MKNKTLNFFFCLCLSFLCGIPLEAENRKDLRVIKNIGESIGLEFQGMTMKHILDRIEKNSDYHFFYKSEDIDFYIIKKDIQNSDIETMLNQLFDGTSIVYTIKGKDIVLKKEDNKIGSISIQQDNNQIIVKGQIIDETGNPIIGASVSEEGTTNGVVTGLDGDFSINVSPKSKLKVSFMGYLSKTIQLSKSKDFYQVMLVEDTKLLDEVVIVGYGTQKKANLTGSVETISSKKLENKPVTSLATALAGEAAGVTIQQTSGRPRAGQASIKIRGIGSWENSSPLILVDGIPMSMDDVIPSQVESITVLKDAASSAIYGSRAANGVVLITTKMGKKGEKNRIIYDGNFGVQRATRLPKSASSWQYAELYNQMMINDGKTPTYSAEKIERLRNGGNPDLNEANTDWYDELIKLGFQQMHQITVSGSSEKVLYSGSIGYTDQTGIIDNTSFKRYNARINSIIEVVKNLAIGLNLSYLQGVEKDANSDDAYRRLGRTYSYMPVKYSDGTWSYATAPTNPVRRVSGEYGSSKYTKDLTTVQIAPEYKVLESLTLKGLLGYTSQSTLNKQFDATVVYDAFEPAGQNAITEVSRNKQTDTRTTYKKLIVNATATYDNSFGNHAIGGLLGGSIERSDYSMNSASRMDFANNDLGEINAGDASTAAASGYSTRQALASLFGRVTYNYASRYLFEANMRYDGSSKFARGHRWGFFPSFSVGWRISEERFFESFKKYVDNFKIRASWGQLGNQNIGDYLSISTINAGGYYMFGNTIYSSYKENRMGNELITWETSTNTNLGFDMDLFASRLNIVFDWYVRDTKDILLSLPTPGLLGISGPVSNAGKVRNKGWELTLNWRDKIGKDFSYHIGFNLSDVKNKVLDLQGYKSPTENLTTRIEGQPIDAIYGWKTLGICETKEEYEKYKDIMKTYNPNWTIGDIIIEDRDGNKKIDADDKEIIGSGIPRYTYGISLGAEYKGFDLSVFFQGVGKADGYVTHEGIAPMGTNGARKDHFRDSFNPADPQSGKYYPRISSVGNEYNYGNMSHWVQDASFLRLKNLQLGYNFKLKKIERLRLYFSAENVFTITKFRTWDPETSIGTRGHYPNVATFSFGTNLTF